MTASAPLTAPVTFGIICDFRNPAQWREPWSRRYGEILDQIAWADSDLAAIDGVFVSEHHFFDDGYMPSSLVVSAAIAARTERVTVGTNLLALPLHDPVRVAEDALVLDVLSGGRFQLGIGAGYVQQEFEALGRHLSHRPSRLEEGIDILRAAFRGTPFSYRGRRFEIPEISIAPPPVRTGGPEIWIGATSPAGIDRAARRADGFICITDGEVAVWADACERHARPLDQRRMNRTYFAVIDEDPERAYAHVAPHFMHLLNEYVARGAFGGMPSIDDPAVARQLFVESGAMIVADAEGAIATLDAAIEGGATDIQFFSVMPGESVERANERLRYVAERVIPFVQPSANPSALVRPPRTEDSM